MIKGKIIKLRALEESDLSKLKDLRNDFKTRAHTREFRLLNMINQVNWFESLFLENELGLHRIWAEIFEIAPERIKLFEKMNFIKEGNLRDKLWRNKKWYDSLIFAKLTDGKQNEKNKTF